MSKYFTIITDIGIAKITNATIYNEQISFKHFVIGDGDGNDTVPNPAQTQLVNETWRGNIAKCVIDEDNPNLINVTAIIPSHIGGFTMREMGLIDDSGDLIAVGNMPVTPKIVIADGVSSELEISMCIAVSNAEAVEIKVDPTVIIATKQDLEKHNNEANAHADIRDKITVLETDNAINKTAINKLELSKADKSELNNIDCRLFGGG